MSLIKYLKRFEYMHRLIRTNSTGNVEEFSRKLGISKRQLFENLKDFKSLGAPIKYSRDIECYYYSCTWEPFNDLKIK